MGRRRFRRLCKIREQFIKVVRLWFVSCVSCGQLTGEYKTRVKVVSLRQFLEQGFRSPRPNQTAAGHCSRCTFPIQLDVEDKQTHARSPTEILSSDSIVLESGKNYYADSFSLPNIPEPLQEESLYKDTRKFVFYKNDWQHPRSPRVPTLEYASDIFSFNDFYNGRRLVQTLHTGDFGRVGLVTVKGHLEKYVLKSFGLQNCDSEVSFLADSQSQFVAKLHGSVNTGCGRLLFLEHYRFGSLDTLTKYGKIVPEKAAVWIIAHLYAATDYIHGLGTLHMDINPSNVLIDNQGYPILTDFGKARKANKWLEPNTISFDKAYCCPELRNKSQPYKTTDYWSIACCLYELMKGRPPLSGGTTLKEQAQTFLELKKDLTGGSVAAYDFFTMELHPFPFRRLGNRGISVLMMHQIFDGLCWKSVKSGCRSNESPLLDLLNTHDYTQSTTNQDHPKDVNISSTVNFNKSSETSNQKKRYPVVKTRAKINLPTVISPDEGNDGGIEEPLDG